MAEFAYQSPFPTGEDTTQYRLISTDHVGVEQVGEHEFLRVAPEALTLLASQAMQDISFFLRAAHNEQVAHILTDPEASDNDRFVALVENRSLEKIDQKTISVA